MLAADVETGKAKTVQGGEIEIVVRDGWVTLDSAKVLEAEIVGSDGVIHVIDSVVLPRN